MGDSAPATWDVDAIRDDLRAYAAERRGTPEGVLIIDENLRRDVIEVRIAGEAPRRSARDRRGELRYALCSGHAASG